MCGFQGTRNRRRSAYCAESFQDGGFGYKVTKLKPRKRRTAQTLHRFPVTMAKGIHLFPYRTQKLSLSAPMVLGWRRPGRVGRCRIPQRKASDECLGLFLCVSGEILLSDHLRRSQRTYLVRIFPAARSAGFQAGKITWESRREKAKETFFISVATSLLSGYLRSSQRMYLVQFNPVRHQWRKHAYLT